MHQRKQNGEWKGGEQESKNSKGRKERREGRKPGNLLVCELFKDMSPNKYNDSSIKITMLRRKYRLIAVPF